MKTPDNLTSWLHDPNALPAWHETLIEYYAMLGNHNARTITQPPQCSSSYLAGKRFIMKEMGITYKSIIWK